MAWLQRTILLGMTADEAWEMVGDFGDMSWHPAIARTELRTGDGHTDRVLTVASTGAQAVERLTGSSARSYSYESLSTPSPTRNYRAEFTVADENGQARVVWTSTFEPKGVSEEEAVAAMTRIYDAGLNALPLRLGEAS